MNPKEQSHIDEEISFIKVLLFIKSSGGNIVKCTLSFLLAGGAYYLFFPSIYKASATIELGKVLGDSVAARTAFMEQTKLPMYFSQSTQQACRSDGELSSKIDVHTNRIAPIVTFAIHARSTMEAKACLNAVTIEILRNLDAINKTSIEQRKQIRQQLNEQLNSVKEKFKKFPAPKKNNLSDEQISYSTFSMVLNTPDAVELSVLIMEVIKLDKEIIALNTYNVAPLVSPPHASEISINKRPLYILTFCLSLGVVLGMLITGLMRVAPSIWRQMQEAESGES